MVQMTSYMWLVIDGGRVPLTIISRSSVLHGYRNGITYLSIALTEAVGPVNTLDGSDFR